MPHEFHIFASDGEQVVTVRQEGLDGAREFSSLAEATRHLRESTGETDDAVVIHDPEGHLNRIPLHPHR